MCSVAHNLLLGVLVGAEQVDCLHVAEVDVMSQEEDEEQLTHVLLLAVAVQSLVSCDTHTHTHTHTHVYDGTC